MKRNKTAEGEGGRGWFNSSSQVKRSNTETFSASLRKEIMNVTLFFSVHVTAYMIGWAQSLDRRISHAGSGLRKPGGGGAKKWFRFYFSLFWFSLHHLAFRLRFRFLFFTFPLSFLTKTKTDRVDHHVLIAGRSIWWIKVFIRPSAALLTMLAQVNFLILPPLIALNQKLYFLSTYLLMLLFRLWKSR